MGFFLGLCCNIVVIKSTLNNKCKRVKRELDVGERVEDDNSHLGVGRPNVERVDKTFNKVEQP